MTVLARNVSRIVLKNVARRLHTEQNKDGELLANLASGDRVHANPTARVAFGEFFQRHSEWLYSRLRNNNAMGLLSPMNDVHDVVQETFFRAFKGAKTFDLNRVVEQSTEAMVRGWLGGIANRVIADMLQNANANEVTSMRLDKRQAVQKDEEPQPESPIVKALRDELKKLSPLQQDILFAAEAHYQPDAKHQRLPNGVTKMLAEKHATSSDNIRQVRRRTVTNLRDKLQALFEEALTSQKRRS